MDYNDLQLITENDEEKFQEYWKSKIKDVFDLYSYDRPGYVQKTKIPTIMRYLGYFPSQVQFADYIMQKLEDDDKSEYISYNKFEEYMLQVIKDNEFLPDEPEIIMASFKLLDPEQRGFIDIDLMKTYLEQNGIPFLSDEIKNFISFATNGDPNAKLFYYEDYVARWYSYVERHKENLMKGYNNFQVKKK